MSRALVTASRRQLATDTDDDDSRLLAGEAMSHLMLSDASASPPVRSLNRFVTSARLVGAGVRGYDGDAYPQVMIRLGSGCD